MKSFSAEKQRNQVYPASAAATFRFSCSNLTDFRFGVFAEFFCDRKSDLLPQKARLNTDFSVYINGLYLDVEFRGILRAAAAGGRTMNFVPIKIK